LNGLNKNEKDEKKDGDKDRVHYIYT
jgi:hypothetical protein